MKKGPSRTFLPGLRLGHVVEEQDVEVRVGGQDAAYALLERIGEMNRSRFLPVIERVFDEFDRPDEIIRIERLDLDLGLFAEADLGKADERLAAALREALRKAMPPRTARETGMPAPFASATTVRGVGEALIDAFLYYLLHGAWPYGSTLDIATAPADLLARLIETEPTALAAMLRRNGRSEALLRRLVGQMPPELLEQLLPVLEPADAAWILVYMKETKASHVEEPIVDESPDEFERLLWTIVLRDALHRAGLRANRRAFLRNLIGRIAESGSASFAELITLLGRGLVAVPGAESGADSLLSIISELDSEQRRGAPPRALTFVELVDWLEWGVSPRTRVRGNRPESLMPGRSGRRPAEGRGSHPERKALAEALRAYPGEARALLTRLIDEDGEALLARLEGLLTTEALARLLLSAAQFAELESRLKAGRDARSKVRLLQAALRGIGSSGRSPAIAAQPDRTPAFDEAGHREAEQAFSTLEWIEQALSLGPKGDTAGWVGTLSGLDPEGDTAVWVGALSGLGPEGDTAGWVGALSRAIAAAAAADPVALRRLMRRFALADPGAFLARTGAGSGTEQALHHLLPSSSGAGLARFVEIAECTPVETASLIRLAAGVSPSASPAALVRRALSLIAGQRGAEAEAMRRTLLVRARQSGGAGGRDLTRLLDQAAEPSIRADGPEAQRAATLDSLRTMLVAPGTVPNAGIPGAAQLSALSGIGADALRDSLSGASLDRAKAATALALLDESALVRLVLLLAPRHGAGRTELRYRLRRSPRGASLAAIAAELLVTGAIERAGENPALPATPRPGAADALRLVERAVRKGGDALAAPDIRAALARLLVEQPFALIGLLAPNRTGLGAAGPPLRDPLMLALAFGALPAAERDLAAALAALIAAPGGRSAIAPDKAASALARAAASMLGRPGGQGLAARWLDEMLRSASLSERAALRRLVASRWPKGSRGPDVLAALGLSPAKGGSAPPAPKRDSRSAATRAKADGPPCAAKGSIEWLVRMLRDRPTGYERLLRRLLNNDKAREMACRALPETMLVRLLTAIAPGEGRSLLAAAELAARAIEASGGTLTRSALWNALLAVAAEGGGIEALLRHMLGGGAGRGLRLPGGVEHESIWARLAALAKARGHQELSTALDELSYDRRKAIALRKDAPGRDRRKHSDLEAKVERKLWEGADDEAGLRIAIANAGLVLVAPFLPAFFKRLDLLDPADPEGKAWRSQQARDRGIHLLQYLVEGRCDRPEPVLALNKLLCGQTLGFPVSASIAPTDVELEICGSLLEAMLANWPMIKDSSVAALQETFLQRDGRIVRIEAGWRIEVERKVLDVIVDQVPWSFSMILQPWMEEPISVTW